MRLLNISFIFLLVFWCACNSFSQHGSSGNIAIAFYNVENFFDTVDNPHKTDDDFTPAGRYRYGTRIYEQKLHNIATAIASMNDGAGPVLLGLAEVENATVLDNLSAQPELGRFGYKHVWYDGPDIRGINVALMYKPELFQLIESKHVFVDLSSVQERSLTRDVLYVKGILADDTVHILINHWPSRRGGVAQSAPKRAIAAAVNKKLIAEIRSADPDAAIIVMGDFNDNPTDGSLTKVLQTTKDKPVPASEILYNPFASFYAHGEGTEVYKHTWNLFDQILVSGALLQGHKLRYKSAQIYKPVFLRDTYKGHEGEPHRSFKGSHWIKGYSDHFPVLIYCTTQ